MIRPWMQYQLRWLADKSRLRVWLKSRRIGASDVVTFDHASEAIGFDYDTGRYDPSAGVNQLMVSTTERRAAGLIEMSLTHIRVLERATKSTLIDSKSMMQIKLKNGCTILALPSGNPDGLHGWTGSVVLDEMAHLPNQRGIYRAALPVANPTLARPKGYRVSVISTPNGAGNLFHDLCESDEGERWSKHVTDVHTAAAEGFPINLDDLRAEVADPDLFAEQFECTFLSGEGQYIGARLYEACLCERKSLPDELHAYGSGYDVARKKDNSASVEVARDRDGRLWVVDCQTAKRMGWDAQRNWVRKLRERGPVAIDESGIGGQFAEELAREGGITRVQMQSQTERDDLITGLKRAFAEDRIRIPKDLTDLRRDVLSIRRVVGESGNVRFVMPRTSQGHADLAVALALAIKVVGKSSVGLGRRPARDARGRKAVGGSEAARVFGAARRHGTDMSAWRGW